MRSLFFAFIVLFSTSPYSLGSNCPTREQAVKTGNLLYQIDTENCHASELITKIDKVSVKFDKLIERYQQECQPNNTNGDKTAKCSALNLEIRSLVNSAQTLERQALEQIEYIKKLLFRRPYSQEWKA